MGIASGRQTSESTGKVLVMGVTPLKVIAVNPTKKELEKIYGRELEKEPEYITADEEGLKKIRFDFIVQTVINDKIGCDVEIFDKVSYFLEDKINVNKDGDKAEVINLYGESTWLTKEAIKTGELPGNMQFYETKGMRPALKGEVDLVNFLKQFLGIPARSFNGKSIANVEDAQIQLDDIKKYFIGNIKEIVSAVNMRKDTNMLKMCGGVKTTDDNKQYQVWFNQKPLKYGVSNYEYLLKAIKEKQANGSYANVDFGPEDLKFRIYENKPTEIKKSVSRETDDLPFGMATTASDDDWFNK